MSEGFIKRHWKGLTTGLGIGAVVGGYEAGQHLVKKIESPQIMVNDLRPRLPKRHEPQQTFNLGDSIEDADEPEDEFAAKRIIDYEKTKEREIKTIEKNNEIINEWMRRFPNLAIKFKYANPSGSTAENEVSFRNRFLDNELVIIGRPIYVRDDDIVSVPTVEAYEVAEGGENNGHVSIFIWGSENMPLQDADAALEKLANIYDADCKYKSGYLNNEQYAAFLKAQGLPTEKEVDDLRNQELFKAYEDYSDMY